MAITRLTGLTFAGVAIAFAISQFSFYRRRVRLSDEEFNASDDRELRFLKRQSWRRLQIAALAGIAGLCMLAGMLLSPGTAPRLFALAWFGVVLFGGWVVVLALADSVSSWLFFTEARQINKAERLALRYKMDKFQEESLRMRDEALRETDESEGSKD